MDKVFGRLAEEALFNPQDLELDGDAGEWYCLYNADRSTSNNNYGELQVNSVPRIVTVSHRRGEIDGSK